MNNITVLKERVMQTGYVLRTERWDNGDSSTVVEQAYMPNGKYIGSKEDAHYLVTKLGIIPEPRIPEHTVCSVGYSPKEKRWYGWGHRGKCSFGKGSRCTKDSVHYTPSAVGGRGEWTAQSIFDAYQMACDFAEAIS